jgi:hypothetical protein
VLKTIVLGACAMSAGLLAGGCGEADQDAHEPRGVFTVGVVRASFPALQAVARPTQLVLTVRNTGLRTLPNVAVGVNSFYYTSDFPDLAARRRPVWIVDDGPGRVPDPPVETIQTDPPGSGTTDNDQIWALGSLAPGALRRFVWRVTPVKPGVHRIFYRVYAGLDGRARARLTGGGVPAGVFTVVIAGRPPKTHVDPQTGEVVPGPYIPTAPDAP